MCELKPTRASGRTAVAFAGEVSSAKEQGPPQAKRLLDARDLVIGEIDAGFSESTGPFLSFSLEFVSREDVRWDRAHLHNLVIGVSSGLVVLDLQLLELDDGAFSLDLHHQRQHHHLPRRTARNTTDARAVLRRSSSATLARPLQALHTRIHTSVGTTKQKGPRQKSLFTEKPSAER